MAHIAKQYAHISRSWCRECLNIGLFDDDWTLQICLFKAQRNSRVLEALMS